MATNKTMKTILLLLCLTAILQAQANAFRSRQHAHPSNNQHQRRRYYQQRQPRYQRHHNDYANSYKEQLRRQQNEHHVQQPPVKGKEIIRDMQDHIELFIPCGRYCRNYVAQLKDRTNGRKKVVVTGQVRNGYQFVRPFYENEWSLPDDIDARAITREITRDGHLKLNFPRRPQDAPVAEVPPLLSAQQGRGQGGGALHQGRVGATYREERNTHRPERQQEAPAKTRMNDDGRPFPEEGKLATGRKWGERLSNVLKEAGAKNQKWKESIQSKANQEMENMREEWRQQEYEPPYPPDPDIEVIELDDCLEDHSAKDNSASIGYWMREKFIYY